MYKMDVTYEDFNGNIKEESVEFNISKMEVIRMQTSKEGGYAEYLERIVNSDNQKEIVEAFEWFVQKAYGRRSEDGTRFIKEDENGTPLINDFRQSPAYDEIIFTLATNEQLAADFVAKVLPQKDLEQTMAQLNAANN